MTLTDNRAALIQKHLLSFTFKDLSPSTGIDEYLHFKWRLFDGKRNLILEIKSTQAWIFSWWVYDQAVMESV